ncbi:hypothetical protein EDD85DRAFT_961557 [Armillaria nabsnona]|nr:hypothetical protein EDD85DRAFT_961557 [Armillaria nabsnona]
MILPLYPADIYKWQTLVGPPFIRTGSFDPPPNSLSLGKRTDPMTEIISGLFSLTEAEMDSLGLFVPSFFVARHAGGVPLEIKRSRILQHWEDHFPHTLLALTDFRKSSEDMAYVRCKKLEKIELFLVHTGYLTKGEAPKDALESGVAAIAQLANVIKNLEAELEAPRSVANLTILDTIPDSAPATHTCDLTTIAIPTLASSTLAARPSSPSSTTGLTDLQSRGYYMRARAHAKNRNSFPSEGNRAFTMDATYPHDMVPFAWGFQEIGQVWGPIMWTPLSTLDLGGKGLHHLLGLHDVLFPRCCSRGIHVTWGLMKNLRIHHPPPQDWSLVEEYLPPLVMIEDSKEEDVDDVQDKRNNFIGFPGPSQHPTSLNIDEGALVVATATADLGAGSKEEVYRQLAAPSDAVANESDMTSGSATLGISLDEWIKVWLPTMDPNFRLGISM